MGKFFRNSHVVEPERRNLAESEKPCGHMF
jgi:hypothetical protein